MARSTPPVARAARQNVVATTITKTVSPAVRMATDATVDPWASASTSPRHSGIAEKLSNAVEPSNTASTATMPGRIGSDGR
ncbi:Uncharacterised protein [Mycobacteroides abscessus subsp. abscessus]|nr:Uncharacterised protein [Mycobacteroides abscessus subsp. abscessus]